MEPNTEPVYRFSEFRTLRDLPFYKQQNALLLNDLPGLPVKLAIQETYRRLYNIPVKGFTLQQSREMYWCILQAILYFCYCGSERNSHAMGTPRCNGCKMVSDSFRLPAAFRGYLTLMGNEESRYRELVFTNIFMHIMHSIELVPKQMAESSGTIYHLYYDLGELADLAGKEDILGKLNFSEYKWDYHGENPIFTPNCPLFLYPVNAIVVRRLIEVIAEQQRRPGGY